MNGGNLNPDPDAGNIEPIRVIDAVNSTETLADLSIFNGDSYSYGYGYDSSPYKVRIDVISLGTDAMLDISYENPLTVCDGIPPEDCPVGAPDAFISPTPKYDGSTPTVTTDIWIDSQLNNIDVDNADGDNDITTGTDAIYPDGTHLATIALPVET